MIMLVPLSPYARKKNFEWNNFLSAEVNECRLNPCGVKYKCKNFDGGYACLESRCPLICSDFPNMALDRGEKVQAQDKTNGSCSLHRIQGKE